jgi:hypothetical protein
MPQVRNRLRRNPVSASTIVLSHASHPTLRQQEPVTVHVSVDGLPDGMDVPATDFLVEGYCVLLAAAIARRLEEHERESGG